MLVVEINEKGHNERPPNYERKRPKELEKLGYYFIGINPDKSGVNNYEERGRISAYIAESIKIQTEESLIHNLSKQQLELEFKSHHLMKSKCLKQIVKKIFLDYKELKTHNQE